MALLAKTGASSFLTTIESAEFFVQNDECLQDVEKSF